MRARAFESDSGKMRVFGTFQNVYVVLCCESIKAVVDQFLSSSVSGTSFVHLPSKTLSDLSEEGSVCLDLRIVLVVTSPHDLGILRAPF